jgi:hypothetical protein
MAWYRDSITLPLCLSVIPPCVSRLSRYCETLNVSQSYGPPWPGTGISLPLPLLYLPTINFMLTHTHPDTRGWLRHYATSRKVAGSIPDEVIEFFN